MPWLASTMMAVKPTLNIALCPKLRRAKVEVVFREAFSYVFKNPSYRWASYFSLLKYYNRHKNNKWDILNHTRPHISLITKFSISIPHAQTPPAPLPQFWQLQWKEDKRFVYETFMNSGHSTNEKMQHAPHWERRQYRDPCHPHILLTLSLRELLHN